MATWSGIRHKLENKYLAHALRGHITYFATSYDKCHDHEGRAAIMYDGKEILSSNYFDHMAEQWKQWHRLQGQGIEENSAHNWKTSFDAALNAGTFDQRCFYRAFEEFDNQSIEKSLHSENPLVRLFAILDYRVGKRTLIKLKDKMEQELEWIKPFYLLRLEAEEIDLR